MKTMKTTILGLALGAMAMTVLPATAQAAPWQSINARQANLDARIDQGIRSGSLTRPEAARLKERFRSLSGLEMRYRHSAPGLTARERADLDRRFNALSASIRVQKHDRQHRW